MSEGRQFFAWEMKGFWIDIGRVGNYIEGNMHSIAGRADVAPDVVIPPDTMLIAPYVIGPHTKIGARCTLGAGRDYRRQLHYRRGRAHLEIGGLRSGDAGRALRLTECVRRR